MAKTISTIRKSSGQIKHIGPINKVYSNILILAAGNGTRLKEVGLDVVKPLAPILGLPLLGINLKNIYSSFPTFKKVLINHKFEHKSSSSQIEDYVNTFMNMYINKIPDDFTLALSKEYKPLGSGSTLFSLKEELSPKYMVIYGDVLTNMSFEWFYKTANKLTQHDQNSIVLLAHKSDTPEQCGVLETKSNDYVIDQASKLGVIVSLLKTIEEKPMNPKTNLVFSGIMLASKHVINHGISYYAQHIERSDNIRYPQIMGIDIAKDILPTIISTRKYNIYVITKPKEIYLQDIGTPEDYYKAQTNWIKLIENNAFSLTEMESLSKTRIPMLNQNLM